LPPASGDLGIPSDEEELAKDAEGKIEVTGEVKLEELTSDDSRDDLEVMNDKPPR